MISERHVSLYFAPHKYPLSSVLFLLPVENTCEKHPVADHIPEIERFILVVVVVFVLVSEEVAIGEGKSVLGIAVNG